MRAFQTPIPRVLGKHTQHTWHSVKNNGGKEKEDKICFCLVIQVDIQTE